MTRLLKIIGSIAVIAGAMIAGAAFFRTSDLDRIHADIAAQYDAVEHIAADDLAGMESGSMILFDVREPEEFGVSHLAAAIRVSPDISAEEFAARFGDMLSGKRAIFYCSVGMRSSIVADRVAGVVRRETRRPPVNLAGGLFRWSNQSRPLVTQGGSGTRAVHPYDEYWGRLIEDRTAISYAPQG